MTTLETYRAAYPSTRIVRQIARAALDRFGACLVTLLEWQERARQRRQLLGLSDGALKDLCITRADVEGEASNPFWRL